MKKQNLIWMMIFILIVSTLCVAAIPIPRGIDGRIFDLESLEEITEPVHISFTDLMTGEYKEGMTNPARPSWYSVALNGEDGDLVIIRIWNDHHSSNKTVTLQGSMHNVNLLLNMTPVPTPIPPSPGGSGSSRGYEEDEGRIRREKEQALKEKAGDIVSSGLEEPHVIEGAVYYADGKTLIDEEVDVIVRNSETGEETIIKAGTGPPGAFSVVVDGEEGDRLEVEAEDKNQLVMLTGDFIQVDTILGRYKNILYDSFGILLIVAGLCVITLSLFRFMKKRGEK